MERQHYGNPQPAPIGAVGLFLGKEVNFSLIMGKVPFERRGIVLGIDGYGVFLEDITNHADPFKAFHHWNSISSIRAVEWR